MKFFVLSLFIALFGAGSDFARALPAEEFYLNDFLIYGPGDCSEYSDEECEESDYDRCSEFGSDSGSEYCRGYDEGDGDGGGGFGEDGL